MQYLPNESTKHLYSGLVGIFLLQWVFGAEWIHSVVSSVVTYLLCALLPRQHSHIVAFAWVMGYMTLCHVYRMYVSYMSGEFDHTGTQMVLTMKLTSFAYNLYDGTADRNRVFASYEDRKKAKVKKHCGFLYDFN